MLAAMRNAGTETTLPFLSVLQGAFGVNFSFCLLLLKSATTSPPRTNFTKWGAPSNLTRRCAKQEAAGIDGFLLNSSTATAATPSPSLIFYQALHSQNPSKLFLPPLITLLLLSSLYFCLHPVVSIFLGEDWLKWRVFFPLRHTRNGEHARVSEKNVGQNLRKEGKQMKYWGR